MIGANTVMVTLNSSTSSSASDTHHGSVSDSETDTISKSSNVTVSLLDRLKMPRANELARKRIVKRNPPHGVKRMKPPTSRFINPRVSLLLTELLYSKDCFVVSAGKLFFARPAQKK